MGECHCRVIIGDLALCRVIRAGKGNTIIYVENGAATSAGRADIACSRNLVCLGIDLATGPYSSARDSGSRSAGGCGILAEVIRGEESASYPGVELCKAVIRAVNHSEAEA